MNKAPVAMPTEKPCSVCREPVDRRRVHRCELERAPVTHIECETEPTLELPGRADRGFWERVDAARAELRAKAA